MSQSQNTRIGKKKKKKKRVGGCEDVNDVACVAFMTVTVVKWVSTNQ